MNKIRKIMQNNRKKIATYGICIITLLLVYTLGATYAYYEPEIGDASVRNVSVETKELDKFTLDVVGSYSFTPLDSSFNQNIVHSNTATATLKANNTRISDTYHYYLYYVADTSFVYTDTTNQQAEVLLQITYNGTVVTGSNAASLGLDLGEVTYVTSNSGLASEISGWDVTDVDFVTIMNNKAMSTAMDTTLTDELEIDVVFVKLDGINQSANYNKTYSASLVIQETEMTFCELNSMNIACQIDSTYDPEDSNTITLTGTGVSGYLYHHDATLTNGAGDGGYRYAGANPNNYVCFGSNASTCPNGNLYRIIGQVPVDVVIDDQTTPITTERQMLYKIIKNDYLTATEVSTGTGTYDSTLHPSTYSGPSGNQYVNDPQGYYWSGSSNNQNNTWSVSTLNTSGLNGEYLTYLGSTWSSKIENVMWKVGGGDNSQIGRTTPMSAVYQNEITESGIHVTNAPTDGKTELPAKVGMMYVVDYGYAAPNTAWSTEPYSYENSGIKENNWLYRGINEWFITRGAKQSYNAYNISNGGNVGGEKIYDKALSARPTIYLNSATIIDMSTHAGTASDPYRIS